MNRWIILALAGPLLAQEAGFEMPVTISSGMMFSGRARNEPRSGSARANGMRAMAYPSIRISRGWHVSGAIQASVRPFFVEHLTTQGTGVRADVLQAYLGYARYWKRNSVVVRVGQLSTAFGSFPLRYDDAANPLVDVPSPYGYYYKPITTLGLPGAQVDATFGAADLRAQFTTSSPPDRRGLFDRDRYATWTGGFGWTIRQGYRIGVSAFRSPYLRPDYGYFIRAETPASRFPTTGLGADIQIARGHWNFQGEAMRIQRSYTLYPTYRQFLIYGEARYALSPRLYLAFRAGHEEANLIPDRQVYEAAVGIRPRAATLIKLGYQILDGPFARAIRDHVMMLQIVQKLDGPSVVF